MNQVNFLELDGPRIVRFKKSEDARGSLSKIYENKIIDSELPISFLYSQNSRKGTVRGLHFQIAPYDEIKFVNCVQGSIYDVILDLRKDSTTFMKWASVKLDDKHNSQLFIPRGFAHGFQTLEDDTLVSYVILGEHSPFHAKRVSVMDATLNIELPLPISIISLDDQNAESLMSLIEKI